MLASKKIGLVVDLVFAVMLVVMMLRRLIRLQFLTVFVVAEKGEADLL